MRLNLAFGCMLLAALALILFTGGLLQAVGYAFIAIVALAELALDRVGARGDAQLPGDTAGGAGVREPRRPAPTGGAGTAAIPLPDPADEPDGPSEPALP